MNILFTTRLPESAFPRLGEHSLLMPDNDCFLPEELSDLLPDADILVPTFDFQVTEDMLIPAQRLKLIAVFGAGYNNIPVNYCLSRGIVVTNTPAPVVEPTAEQCFALMHALLHRTAELDRRLRMPGYDGIRFGVMHNLGTGLYRKTLGIIGMGRIGQALARRAVAAGMTVIYHNRHRLPLHTEQLYGARYVSRDELLQTADVVSLNLPYTPDVHHLIGTHELQMMKKSAFLINTARGAHVSEQALAQALLDGTIAGAALDVFENEPQINPLLLKCDNVVLSPHIGTGTMDGRIEMCRNVEDNIIAFLNNDYNKLNKVI